MNRKTWQTTVPESQRVGHDLATNTHAVNKASGCNEMPVELFRFLKDDAIKVLHSLCQQIWEAQQWLQDWNCLVQIGFRSYLNGLVVFSSI